jgi:hypothetical protein
MLWIASVAALWAAARPPAAAQGWSEFADNETGFTVLAPAKLARESATYNVNLPDGQTLSVPALIFSTEDQNNHYSVTVADLANTPADDPNAIDRAAAAMRESGDVKLDLWTSVAGSACGRDLTIADRDGEQSTLALFFQPATTHRLYVFRAKATSPSAADDGAADALQFQQSVNFIPPAAKTAPPETEDDQRWTRYFYYASRFSMRFPAEPKVTVGAYRTAGGVKANTLEYTVRQKSGFYRVTVANLWHTPADTLSAIDEAVGLLRRDRNVLSETTVNIDGGQCGRDLRIAGRHGAQSIATIVFPTASHWLYLIEAETTSPDPETDLARFRKSFRLYWNTDGTPPNG